MKWTLSVLFLCFQPAFTQTVVNNDIKPVNPPYTLSFVEELRFGDGEDEGFYLFANNNSTVTADNQGNMYVAEAAGVRVLAFDATGKFQRILADKGEGPGEFRGLPSFQILDDGSAVGIDQIMMSIPRFYYFDKALKFVEHKVPVGTGGAVPANGFFNHDGSYFYGMAFRMDMQNQQLELGWCLFQGDYHVAERLSSYKMPMPDLTKMGDPAMWRKQFKHQLRYGFSGLGSCAFDSQGRIYIGDAGKYKITRWDPEFKKEELVIQRKYKPVNYSKADMDAFVGDVVDQVMQSPMPQLADIFTDQFIRQSVEAAELPPTKPAIQGLLVTHDGDILSLSDIQMATRNQVADVFSPEGKYLGKITLANHAFFNPFTNLPRMSFRNGRAYTMEVNENGDVQVVRYRIERVKTS